MQVTEEDIKHGAALMQWAMWLVNNWRVLLATLAAIAALQVVQYFRRKASKPFLNPEEYQPLVLTEKRYITHNTCKLKFDLPDPDMRLGLPIGQHISFWAKDADGADVYRSYTPTSDDDTLGSVEFVIKLYPQGKMSQALAKLAVGESMQMKGPKGRLTYTPNMANHIGMLAGGTGITPMYQVLNAILKNKKDKTKVSLIFANLSVNDILLRNELAELEQAHPDRLSIYYVLNEAAEGWSGGVGFITPDMIHNNLPAPGPGVLVLRCGPLPMMTVMKEHLNKLGYSEEMQFQF